MTLIESEDSGDRLQVANIQFNNLDIIANQETIVELLGFAQRVMPKSNNMKTVKTEITQLDDIKMNMRTEITFDFHRLNVLILRAVNRENFTVARKVGTFTMCDARIHATIGKLIKVEGSLGGLQVLDLTPEGINHQRIVSIGSDPLTDVHSDNLDPMTSIGNEMYGIKMPQNEERRALSFKISRNLNAHVEVKVRMASVWFIHCARFIQELSWCASEFRHYLK